MARPLINTHPNYKPAGWIFFASPRRWAAFHIENAPSTLLIGDNLMGDIIANGTTSGRTYVMNKTSYILPTVNSAASIESYEGSFRVTFTNLWFDGVLSHPVETRLKSLSKKSVSQQLEIIHNEAESMLADIRTFIASEIRESPTTSEK
jgi:hypothetical protein